MKNKNVAGALAIFFGIFGTHRFYLGQRFLGALYFFLFWAGLAITIEENNPIVMFLPALISLVDSIVFFAMPWEDFDRRYNKAYFKQNQQQQETPRMIPVAATPPAPHISKFDKQKIIWEKENGTSVKPEPIKPNDRSVHQRASSFSYISSPITQTPEKAKKPDNAEGYMEKQQRLQNLQNELKELTKESPNASGDVKIESVKNQIARLRADLAMSESSKTTRLINNVMISMQKEAQRDEKGKKLAIANIFNKFIDEGFLKTLN